MGRLERLKVKLFADGADLAGITEMASNPMIALHNQSNLDAQGRNLRL